MLAASLTYLWILTLTAFAGGCEAPQRASFKAAPLPSSAVVTSAGDDSGLLAVDGSTVTSNDSAQRDDEVEIPDESDNEDDDDLGEAMGRGGRSTTLSIAVAVAILPRPSCTHPTRPLDRVDARSDLSPFLRFCRLLI